MVIMELEEPPAVKVRVERLKDVLHPVPGTLAVRVTVPAKPFTLDTVMLDRP
jgi:hypothetical protein